ncbi:lysophospholipid acyltransferase family protein [Lichenibacterium ramalinae]|uniref:Lauroyl acyltransferase n=1 Tax=Lichenibacterium ramalinae TaxID=2316527 RepID=A0A4Q2RD70_9HYPH|nr:lauroyl acyltransferase [Lichenibacterium ramalinae]RYB05665.1 lauroyl acyltransferase [Lichenibacterium ramalinae]
MRFAWRPARHRLEHRLFGAAGTLFRLMGLERASAISGGIWRAVAPLTRRHGRALNHLALALPDTTAAEREAIVRTMWENLGRTFAEAFFLREIAAGDRVTFENQAAFDAWRAWPGGKVACAAHLANWELAIAPATRSGLAPWSIYKRLRNPLVDQDVHALRAHLYTGGLVPKDAGVPRQFLRVIRGGGTVGLLTDLRDGAGDLVPFFGRPAHTTTFPALLALSAGSPILVSCMRRVAGVRFVQSYELVHMPASGDRRADLLAVTAEVQAVFERFIRQWPDQWMWAHRRWG